MYTLRTISNGLVSKLSSFSIDNKMMKVLYNVDKLDENGDQIKPKHAIFSQDGQEILRNNIT